MLGISRIIRILRRLSDSRGHGIGVMGVSLGVLRVDVLAWYSARLLGMVRLGSEQCVDDSYRKLCHYRLELWRADDA